MSGSTRIITNLDSSNFTLIRGSFSLADCQSLGCFGIPAVFWIEAAKPDTRGAALHQEREESGVCRNSQAGFRRNDAKPDTR